MAMVGCENPDNGGNNGGGGVSGNLDAIAQEWKLVSVNGVPAEFNVYIGFTEEGTFTMYQQMYTLDYKFYDGTYEISGNKLTGEYFDHGAWKSDYVGGISEDGSTLTLTSDEDNAIKSVYKSCEIPQIVKDEALAGTRAEEVVPFL